MSSIRDGANLKCDAEDQDRGHLDAYDRSFGHVVGTNGGASNQDRAPENDESPASAGLGTERAREDSNL